MNIAVDNRSSTYARVWLLTIPDPGFDVIPFFSPVPLLGVDGLQAGTDDIGMM